MAGGIDTFLLEKELGNKFAVRIRRNLIASIKSKTKEKTKLSLKSTVKPVYKNGLLYSIVITTPFYIYPILHYGFEGSKKNGINQRLKARDFLVDAIDNGKITQELATEIGNVRATEIMSRINFIFLDNNLAQ